MVKNEDLLELIDNDVLREILRGDDLVGMVKGFLNSQFKKRNKISAQILRGCEELLKDKIVADPAGFVSIAELREFRRGLPYRLTRNVISQYMREKGFVYTRKYIVSHKVGEQLRGWSGASLKSEAVK